MFPGCDQVLASVKSCQNHAVRALKNGRCPDTQRVSRPYSFGIERIEYEDECICPLCKQELRGKENIRVHMVQHFQALPDREEEQGCVSVSHGVDEEFGREEFQRSGGELDDSECREYEVDGSRLSDVGGEKHDKGSREYSVKEGGGHQSNESIGGNMQQRGDEAGVSSGHELGSQQIKGHSRGSKSKSMRFDWGRIQREPGQQSLRTGNVCSWCLITTWTEYFC